METSTQTIPQSNGNIEALEQEADELARASETLPIQTRAEPGEESVEQEARDLADEIESLEQQARVLATNVETSRVQTLMQSDEKIET